MGNLNCRDALEPRRQTKFYSGKDTSWRGIYERRYGKSVREFDPEADYSEGRKSGTFHRNHVARPMKEWNLNGL